MDESSPFQDSVVHGGGQVLVVQHPALQRLVGGEDHGAFRKVRSLTTWNRTLAASCPTIHSLPGRTRIVHVSRNVGHVEAIFR